MRSARGRAGLLGFLVTCLGIWGGIVAFVGPTFDFDVRGTGKAWVWDQGHATLSVAPAVGAMVGGLLMMAAAGWAVERLGALLALIGGAWFVVGPSLQPLWNPDGLIGSGSGTLGASGSPSHRALEAIGYFYGTGALIVALAAAALGLLAVAEARAAVAQTRTGRKRIRPSFRHPSHA